MRVVFMGTPNFAVPSLIALCEAGYNIAGVFCQPDRPAGRGHRLQPCAVKVEAEKLGLPVYQFERIRRKEGLAALRQLAPDVCVTAAFGQILSQNVLNIPRLGTVNVHGSLLPKYRGAAPIQWAVINGEKQTGVTTMLTDIGIDTGDMLLCETTDIGSHETAGELFERLSVIGAGLLVRTLKAMEEGALHPVKQIEADATHFPMLTREHGRINWNASAETICNLVRGVTPWPGAYGTINGETYKIWKVGPVQKSGVSGEILEAGPRFVTACGNGAIEILEIQAPGGKRMPAVAWLRGNVLTAKRWDDLEETIL